MRKLLLIAIVALAAVLRLYKLGSVPPSLYWDEVSLGYNAYSILTTGHDEHGKSTPLTNFAAFGDYKPPGYIYAAVPAIALFGLNEFAVRFPSALFGILTVVLTYLMARKLFENEIIAILASFFLAISPWHIQFSRGAFEANLGLFFSTLGIYTFLKFAKDGSKWLFLSGISFIAAMYTFTGQRLFVPLILVVLLIQFKKQVFKNPGMILVTGIVSLIFIWPLFKFATQTLEGRLRFEEVNIFRDLAPSDESIKYREQDKSAWWSQIIHNRRILYAHQYLIHYFDAFNPNFLFFRGDVNPRLSIQEVGELYYFDLILITTGIYFLFAKKFQYRWLIIGWLLISPLGPAIARETPHALRMIHILPTFQLIGAFGLYNIYNKIKYKKVTVAVICVTIFASLYYYLHMYYIHWPKNYSGSWQYGYKQAVQAVKENLGEVDRVIITKSLGRPYIYFLFYLKFNPDEYLKTANITKDKFYFIDVQSFDKFTFTDSPGEFSSTDNALFVTTPEELPKNAEKITTIYQLDKKPIFDIGIIK